MILQEAINLLKKAVPPSVQPQYWADLGCGTGTFTHALAHLLPKGSHIYAIDRAMQRLPAITGNNVSVDFEKADFENANFTFSNLDGILMANSLHYIKNKRSLILHLEKYLSYDKKLLIIEYDTTMAHQWVPYPVSFSHLKSLFLSMRNREINKIAEHKSVYGQGNLYAAVTNSIK